MQSSRDLPPVAATAALLLLALLMEIACGVPGPPVPPTPKIPQPVADLAARQEGETVRLSWTLPQLHTDGTRLDGFPSLEIHRAFVDSAAGSFEQRAQLAYVLPPAMVETLRAGNRVLFTDPLGPDALNAPEGRLVAYAIKAKNRKQQDAGFGPAAYVHVYPVPEVVTSVRATVVEEGVRLSWEPPQHTTSGKPLGVISRYRIYRSATGEEGTFTQLETAESAAYTDSQALPGQTYYYRVRAVARYGDNEVASADSVSAQVQVEDRFPPAAPTRLVAVAGPGQVGLTWDASSSSDVTGYYLYRRRRPEASWQRLNPEPILSLSYTDKDVQPRVTYYYAVTAIDGNGNESSRSNQADAVPFQQE